MISCSAFLVQNPSLLRTLGVRRVGLAQVDRVPAAEILYYVNRKEKEVWFVSPDGGKYANYPYSFKSFFLTAGEVAKRVFNEQHCHLSGFYEDVRLYDEWYQTQEPEDFYANYDPEESEDFYTNYDSQELEDFYTNYDSEEF